MIPLKSLLGFPLFAALWITREVSEYVEAGAQYAWGAADSGLRWLAADDPAPRPDEKGVEE